MSDSIFWYDLETFGAHTMNARIAQIAGIRTDLDLNPIGEPMNVLVRLADDWLPDPGSCAITGITPQDCAEKGITEVEALQMLYQEMAQPGTIVAGYNSSHFDDRIVSLSNYRNGLNPYPISYQNKNKRLDLLNVVRLVYAVRPQGMEWPLNDKQVVSFTLQNLAKANGIAQDQAHDALWDVKATIDLARKIKSVQPKLFDYLIENVDESALANKLNLNWKNGDLDESQEPIILSSGRSSADNKRCFVTLPLCTINGNKKQILSWHLRQDPAELNDLSAEQIKMRMFSTNEVLAEKGLERIQAPVIRLNQAPSFVAALPQLENPKMEQWLNIELDDVYARMDAWDNNRHIWLPKLLTALIRDESFDADQTKDVDLQIYNGFISDVDRATFEKALNMSWEDSQKQNFEFSEDRLSRIWARIRARNAFHTMNPADQSKWKIFVKRQLLQSEKGRTSWHMYDALCAQIIKDHPHQKAVIEQLLVHAQDLKTTYDLPEFNAPVD